MEAKGQEPQGSQEGESSSSQNSEEQNGMSLRKRKKKPEEELDFALPNARKGRHDLSIGEKIKVLEMLDASPKMSQRKAALTCNVSQSQVSRIQNNKISIMEKWRVGNFDRKRLRIGKGGGVLEEKLFEWYNEATKECVPLSGPLFIEKAKGIAAEMGIKFNPTSGWFGRWKARNNITLKGTKSKNESASYSKLCNHWRRYTFSKLTKDIEPNNIWFLGKTNLYFDASFSDASELSANISNLKNINLIFAYASTGIARRKPLVIGAENLLNTNIPVEYIHVESGTITRDLFTKWLQKWDNELKKLKTNIVLFLQKESYCPENISLSCISLNYYPECLYDDDDQLPIQPFNEDIVTTFKSLYRYQVCTQFSVSELLKTQVNSSLLLNNANFIKSISNLLPFEFSLLDAVYMISRAWEHLNPVVLVKGIVKAGLSKEVVALSSPGSVPPPPTLTKEQFELFVQSDFNIGKKLNAMDILTNSSSKDTVNKPPNPSEVEIVLACKILRTHLQNSSSSDVDQFAKIEAAIQNSILSPNANSLVFHPLYSIDSNHSLEGHKAALRDLASFCDNTSEQLNEDSTRSSNQNNPEIKTHQMPSRYVNSNVDSSILQQPQFHSTLNYATPNFISQATSDVKGIPMVVTRNLSDLRFNQRFAIRADLTHHTHTFQEMNHHFLPVADMNNQTTNFITFAPHF